MHLRGVAVPLRRLCLRLRPTRVGQTARVERKVRERGTDTTGYVRGMYGIVRRVGDACVHTRPPPPLQIPPKKTPKKRPQKTLQKRPKNAS